MTHVSAYFEQVAEIARRLDQERIAALADGLAALRQRGGRLFLLGVGGSAANCAHAVNDFRKLCGIEAYAPTDDVSELTARVNDESWETVFANWLRGSRLWRQAMTLPNAHASTTFFHQAEPLQILRRII